MPASSLTGFFVWEQSVGMTDAQLLEQFVTGDDESAALAFEAIVERHGSMVLRVCRTVLRDVHAAEDAFQATFLVLARKARTLDHASCWATGSTESPVARHGRRRPSPRGSESATNTQPATDLSRSSNPPRDASQDDLEQVFHEEIDRLPRPYRAAVVVCYLEGMTQAQAAQQLRLAESTIRGRLARARKLLGQRLTRRGVGTLDRTGLHSTPSAECVPRGHSPARPHEPRPEAALLFVKRGRR